MEGSCAFRIQVLATRVDECVFIVTHSDITINGFGEEPDCMDWNWIGKLLIGWPASNAALIDSNKLCM